MVGSVSDIVWALRTAVSPDVLASVQGLVYIQSLGLVPKDLSSKRKQKSCLLQKGGIEVASSIRVAQTK